jgi:peptidyl serine alpha-galactosyltransferase
MVPIGRGWAMGAFFSYMVGTRNNLSETHVPHIAPRNDSLAGVPGRRSDQAQTDR